MSILFLLTHKERQRGDRTGTGLKHSQGEECSRHGVQDSSLVTTPLALQEHSHTGEAEGTPQDAGTAPAQPDTGDASKVWFLGHGSKHL